MRSSKHGPPQERVTRVLQAGALCFGRKGFFEATFDDVVRESGLSRGSLYWYFASKEELYGAVLEYAASRLDTAFDAGAQGLDEDGPLITRFLESIADDVDAQEEIYRVLYMAPRPASATARITRLTLRFVEYVRQVVEEAARRGEAGGHSKEALVDIVHALAEGLIIRRLCDPGFEVARYIGTAGELLRGEERGAHGSGETADHARCRCRTEDR